MNELVVVTGIPKILIPTVEREINNPKQPRIRNTTKVYYVPAPEKAPYYSAAHIEEIFRQILLKIYAQDNFPEILRMLYMPANDSVALQKEFYTIAMLEELDCCIWNGRNIDSAILSANILNKVRNGNVIPRFSKRDFRMLPLENFYVSSEVRIKDAFEESFFNKGKDFEELKSQLATIGPTFNRSVYQDSRECIFTPCASQEEHGSDWDGERYKLRLQGMYRFGRFFGSGFHFDVTRARTLDTLTFFNANDGEFLKAHGSTTHVNIYLNDVVRGPGLKSLKKKAQKKEKPPK